MLKTVMCATLLGTASANAGNSNCEGFNLTFKNNLPSGIKVVNANLSGAQMDPTEFLKLDKGANQSFVLKFVNADNIVGHFEFETQDKIKKHFAIDFNLADAVARCSHVDNTVSEKEGVQISSSRHYGDVAYSFSK